MFDESFLWRAEAARALDLDGDELVAALCPGASYPAVLRSMLAALPVSLPRLVDLGAGPGGASEWLRVRTGATVTAVEPSAAGRWVAEGLFPELDVVDGTAEDSGLDDRSADAVVLCGVLSLRPDAGKVLTEVGRIATDTAAVAIADLFAHERTMTSGPNVFRTIDDVADRLTRRGWRVIEIGCGTAQVDPSWADAATRIDEWIETRCATRRGFEAWVTDRAHLERHVARGTVLGGCVVAVRADTVQLAG